MARTPEGNLKRKIKDYLNSIGAVYFMVPQGAYCTPGAPDMVVVYNGMTYHTEAKTDIGKLRKGQVRMGFKLVSHKVPYVIVRSVDEVKVMLEEGQDGDYMRKNSQQLYSILELIYEKVDDAISGQDDLSDTMYDIRDMLEEVLNESNAD